LVSLKTTIRVKDFEVSKMFYTTILQFNIVEEYNDDDDDGSRGCIFRIGSEESNAFVEISEIEPKHDYFNSAFKNDFLNDKIDLQIKTSSIVFWTERLQKLWKVRGPVDRPWGSQYLYLRDPDGLQIIIYQENKKNKFTR